MECEIPRVNAPSEKIKEILKKSKTIAIVGISKNEDKASFDVARYLKNNGYKIIPINPKYEEILGEKCLPSIKDYEGEIDLIDIFRKIDSIPEITEEIMSLNYKPICVWFQQGIIHNKCAEKLESSNISVVQNKCTKVEHIRIS